MSDLYDTIVRWSNKVSCNRLGHAWVDVHRAIEPSLWVVVKQWCPRCQATRPAGSDADAQAR